MKPDSASAHLNLGILLMNLSQFRAAVSEFEEALRLAPGNALAQDYLRQAQARNRR